MDDGKSRGAFCSRWLIQREIFKSRGFTDFDIVQGCRHTHVLVTLGRGEFCGIHLHIKLETDAGDPIHQSIKPSR